MRRPIRSALGLRRSERDKDEHVFEHTEQRGQNRGRAAGPPTASSLSRLRRYATRAATAQRGLRRSTGMRRSPAISS